MGCLILSGGREDPPLPRPFEADPREDPYEPRFSLRPADSLALLDSLARADSEAERDGIGENFCQPPLLPLSRAMVELPGRAVEPTFELPRVSAPLPEFWFERWNPLFEEPFPGRELSRLFPIDLLFDAVDAPLAEKKC